MSTDVPKSADRAAATSPADGRSRRGFGWVGVPVAIFLALAGLFGLALSSGDPSKLPSALIGRPAPQIALPPLDGLEKGGKPVAGLKTADLGKGQVALVNFWASWCAPCVQEHPFLTRLAKQTGLPLYGVNYKDQTGNALQFLAKLGNPYTAVGVDASGRAAIEWGVYGMPETFIIDGAGRIVYKHVGPITERVISEKLLPAIRTAQAQPGS